MRIAALAFGVLAGLVASLILALGGLDAAALVGVDQRQHALIRFGLFIIANFGVFGAGLVLASPLAGGVLLIVGAFAWVGAALILHHGPDYVMLTPPGLLLLAAGLAIAAYLRRPQFDDDEFGLAQAAVTQRAAIAAQQNDEGDEDEADGAVPVGASFFGEAGTATSMHGAMARQPEPQRRESDDWLPVRRRVEPPRQKPMFRQPDDEYDDEESGFSRGARITSSILSFGLYGALAAAAVLVFVNLRTGDVSQRSATKIEASTPISSKAPAPAVSSQPQVAQSPTLEASRSASIAPAAPVAPTLAPSLVPSPGTIIVSEPIQQPAAEPSLPLVAEASQEPQPSAAPSSSSEPAVEPGPEDLTAGAAPPTGPLMPFAMPPQVAASRARTPARPSSPAAPVKPRIDQGI